MYGKVGANNIANGGVGPVRIASDGAVVVSAGLADAALAGRLFCAAMQTPTTTSTTLNTTFVGLALCNPTGSGKIIIVREFSWINTAALTAMAALALATTTDSGFATDIVPRCCRYGYANSVAIVDKGATIVAPVIERPIATLGTAATTAINSVGWQRADLGGSMILVPGRAVVTDTTAATGAVMQFGYVWEEIPL
jgi:hypothetical protein